jgi:hypothetical protein
MTDAWSYICFGLGFCAGMVFWAVFAGSKLSRLTDD